MIWLIDLTDVAIHCITLWSAVNLVTAMQTEGLFPLSFVGFGYCLMNSVKALHGTIEHQEFMDRLRASHEQLLAELNTLED